MTKIYSVHWLRLVFIRMDSRISLNCGVIGMSNILRDISILKV